MYARKATMEVKFTVFAALVALLAFLSYTYIHYERRGRLLRNVFPCVPKLPFLGSIPFCVGPLEVIAKRLTLWSHKLGRNFVFWVGHTPVLVVTEVGPVAQAIWTSSKTIERGPLSRRVLQWLLGNGILTSKGAIWRSNRKLLNRSFQHQRVQDLLTVFSKNVQTLVEDLKELDFTKSMDLHPILMKTTMRSITESILGDADEIRISESFQRLSVAVKYAMELMLSKLIQPWMSLPIVRELSGDTIKEQFCTEILEKFINRSVQQRREKVANDSYTAVDDVKPLVDSLILDDLSDNEITTHVLTLFGAGFDNVASAMNYTLILLAMYPKWQEKVQAELDDIILEKNEFDLTFDQLSGMQVLEACIKETLRLYPTGPLTSRFLIEDITLEDGRIIPKNVHVAFIIREMHRDERAFPDPNVFNPARFLEHGLNEESISSFVAFGLGPRNCIGKRFAMIQLKATLAHILANFNVSTLQKEGSLDLWPSFAAKPMKISLSPRFQSRVTKFGE